MGLPRFCHITPTLYSLHWLPIKYRIHFKILLATYKCLHGLAPQYLADLLSVAKASRYDLRRRNAVLLVPASVKCKVTLGTGRSSQLPPNYGIVSQRTLGKQTP